MNQAQAGVGYRLQIRPTVGTPASGNDIQNINTGPLTSGECCYVLMTQGLYVLDKESAETPSGLNIVVANGGGRWKLISGPAGILGAMIYTTVATNDFVTDGDWQPVSTSNFALARLSNALFTLTAAGGIVTYDGPRTPVIARLTAAVRVADGTPAQQVYGVISHNDDMTGALAAGGPSGATAFVQDVDAEHSILATQRLINELVAGDTIRMKFGAAAGGVAGTLVAAQLTLQAA